MRLSIFAYHVQCIAITKAPAVFTLSPCDGVVADVRIEPTRHAASGSIWDEVTVNGQSAGNRAGGVKAFCKLVAAVKPEIDWT
jgi:hypothetical protein